MIQDLRSQAERAERLAKSINDARTSEALLKYAQECREKVEAQSSPDSAPTSVLGDKYAAPRTRAQPPT